MGQDSIHLMLTTMVAAISVGVILIVLSHRLNTSSVVLLLLGGIALGPEFLNVVQPDSLGDGLPVIVSLAIGLILFEGGLTLNLSGYRSASRMIQRLLTVGTLTTWLTTATAIWLIFGFDFSFALLAASLVIVTGPTVIAPLLKRIKVKSNLHSILHWEGVLIDPVGVFVAILCFEWITGQDMAVARFGMRFVWGIGLGGVGGLAIYRLIRSKWVQDDMMNVFALASAVLIFGIAEGLFSESGLLAVTVAGFVLGLKRPGELKAIRQFKAEITDLLIGTLFILLSARLELDQFEAFGWRGGLLVGVVIVAARPLNILLSSWGLGLSWREKSFLSWVAPRGIVAASMASLFTLSLEQQHDMPNASFIETFTYSVIVSTVLLQGLTADFFARVLKLKRPAPTGWLIVGAHALGRRIARFIGEASGYPVVLIDNNPGAVAEARAEGLVALLEDAREPGLEEEDELQEVGHLLALTDNEDLNLLLCQHWEDYLGKDRVFYWRSGRTDAGELFGKPVWDGLPKPSHLSGELERGEAVLVPMSALPPDTGGLTRPLVMLHQGGVFLNPDQVEGADVSPDAVLTLRREAEYLAASLLPECVAQIDVKDKEELLAQLVHLVSSQAPELPAEEILRDLTAREQAFPSVLGHGVAVPHAYCSELQARLCIVAQVPSGIDFGAMDGEPVRLVFFLLSPPDDPEGHLETLAEIARIVSHEETRASLFSATDPSEVMEIIRRSSG
ncbi:MAG: cation:proton antiporter [bacterium]|nr:cation:proton antiporter [bacterium]